MRNVRFTPDVVKELRRLVRDSSKGTELQAALQKIYTTGYDNGLLEAAKQVRRAVTANANNQSASTSHDNDGVVIQSAGSEQRTSEGPYATDSDSSIGSDAAERRSKHIVKFVKFV